MFLGSVGTFLLSKEYWVLDHEFYVGVGLFIIFAAVRSNFGASIDEFISKEQDKETAALKAIRQDEIDR